MALPISAGAPTLFVRRDAYEASGLSRAEIDERLSLGAHEFRVEANCIAIGPIYGEGGNALTELIGELESRGLVYFEDFFELSGNWPEWLTLYAASRRVRGQRRFVSSADGDAGVSGPRRSRPCQPHS